MTKSWVVVANAGRARIFEAATPMAGLDEKQGLVNPEVRRAARQGYSDEAGRAVDRSGGARHALERQHDPREQATARFAKRIAANLQKAAHGHRFDRLYLVCAPTFLGMLRESLSGPVSARVVGTVDKDLTTQTPAAVRAALPERL